MAGSFGALCNDHYVNLKIGLKLELPQRRETVLGFFERMRRQYPAMSEFRKYAEELALESPVDSLPHAWLAVRSKSVRAGMVNPPTLEQAYRLHRSVIEVSPFFLDISPLDVSFVEVLFGFDLPANAKPDAVLGDVLLGQSVLGSILEMDGCQLNDFQPLMGFTLNDGSEAWVEVKTRSDRSKPSGRDEPVSVFLILRKRGPIDVLDDLSTIFDQLINHGETMIDECIVPKLVRPIRESIVPGL